MNQELKSLEVEKMRKNKLSTYCNCENCTNCRCQEDKYTCKDKTVIDGYMPTQDYYYCRGERFDRKKV